MLASGAVMRCLALQVSFEISAENKSTGSRRSTRVIWFREGSPEEGDRIVAWYKLEWVLGLSSGLVWGGSPTKGIIAL